MLLRLTIPALAFAATVATLPLRAEAELSSQNHPVLQRALGENAGADKNGDGLLSLEEYQELQPQKVRQNNPQEPAPLLPVLPNGEVVVADFEDNNFRNQNGWTAEGTAFNRDLGQCTRLMKRRVGSYEGKFLLSTITESENEIGRLLSPLLKLELDYLVVTMSGGQFPQRVGVNLWVDEQLVRSATGKNDDYFEEVALDVREFRNRMARVEVLDQHPGLWGHLNLDRIVLRTAPGEARNVSEKPVPVASLDGFAVTLSERKEGALTIEDAQLVAGGAPFADDQVLLALHARQPVTQSQPGAVHLLDGEIWQATLRDVEGKGKARELSIHSPIFGDRKVPLERLASMEFIAGSASDPREPGHLYRADGEPIPGKLIWVRQKDIAINCALGIIPVPRASVQRFVLATPQPPATRAVDEIGLMDGTLLFGSSKFEGEQLVIAHEVLGELKLPWSLVRYLRRNRPGITWLDTLDHTVVESIGPALPPPAPELLESGEDSHLRALRIMPHTVVRMPLPSGPHSGATLRAQLATVPGARGDVQVSVLAGDSTVWNQRIAAGSAPIPLSVNLSSAAELTLRVEFAGPLSFPCGIDLRDAHVITLSNLGTEPNK